MPIIVYLTNNQFVIYYLRTKMQSFSVITIILSVVLLSGCSVTYSKTVPNDTYNKGKITKIALHNGWKSPIASDICGSPDYALAYQAKKMVLDGEVFDVYHCITKDSLASDRNSEDDNYSDDLQQSKIDELF